VTEEADNQQPRPFELVEAKLAEARFFLEQLEGAGLNVFAARCYFSAFVTAARSVTFVLKAVLAHASGFPEWYQAWERALGSDPVARYLLRQRNKVQKTGETGMSAGSMTRTADGELVVTHYFASEGAEAVEGDVLGACRAYAERLEQVVADARKVFPRETDPDWLFEEENLRSEGLTVEDLEERLGLPRGWTAPGHAQERLDGLRDSTIPAMAEHVAHRIIDIAESERQEPASEGGRH